MSAEWSMSPLARATQAIIAELHRQAETTGCTTEDHGDIVEVDGHFRARPLVRAILQAIREPSPDMANLGGIIRTRTDLPAGAGDIWRAMIDAALEEG